MNRFEVVLSNPTCAATPGRRYPVDILYTRQGLTLVHISAQPEPFVTLRTSPKRLKTPTTHAIHTP